MKTSPATNDATVIAPIDLQLVADVESAMACVRSNIRDLSVGAAEVIDEMLAILAPLHRQVVDVIDLTREVGAADEGSNRADTTSRESVR